MPELNANTPAIECYVRGQYLRDQIDSHDVVFPCMIFGVSSIQGRSPQFHFLMEDGGIWWRMPINAFCTRRTSSPLFPRAGNVVVVNDAETLAAATAGAGAGVATGAGVTTGAINPNAVAVLASKMPVTAIPLSD